MLGMLDKDRKGVALEIVTNKLKGEDHKEPEGKEADMQMAADEIMSALDAKDSVALKNALYAFFEVCSHGEEAEEVESEPEVEG